MTPFADQPNVVCNLCRAVGDSYELNPNDPNWSVDMQIHTKLRHPEHEAALLSGEVYVPVEVDP